MSTTDIIHSYLIEACGYQPDCIKSNYAYSDSQGKECSIPLAAFADKTFDYKSSCIGVVDGTSTPKDNYTSWISSFRGLGVPIIFSCFSDKIEWWKIKSDGVEQQGKAISMKAVKEFFVKQKNNLSPDKIFRAKNFGKVQKSFQLSFVDLGLMPLIEKQEGEYLSSLVERINGALYKYRKEPNVNEKLSRWLFQAGFWLIGAKILKDKDVPGFKTLKLTDIECLIDKIQRHYDAGKQLDITKNVQRSALERVAKEIVEPVSSFAQITTESLAYVYENALVSEETRKKMGTHATPAWLVNYIVWQLIDWIEGIPEDDRVVLEPTCGHAPFLTAAARVLSFLYKGSDEQKHAYLKDHLIGIERDSFAEEIARLALTLSDVPNKDGWQIDNYDVYATNALQRIAQKATILLCNPPFENFSQDEKSAYTNRKTDNKAAEVLFRTLPYMPQGSVFGVILPQGFLHKKNLANLRKEILDKYELRTICNLPDNVFAKAGHPSTVLLGRKIRSKKQVSYLRVPKIKLEGFKDTYSVPEEKVPKNVFYTAENYSFRLPQLKEVWEFCKTFPSLKKYIKTGRGFEYKSGLTIEERRSIKKFEGSARGFYDYDDNAYIDKLPRTIWLNVSDRYIKNRASGFSGQPRIVVNRIRGSRTPWRLRAWIDVKGHPCSKTFLSVVPVSEISLQLIWALLNSPVANAFLDDHCMSQDNNEGVLELIPVPYENQDLTVLARMVEKYFSFREETGILEDANLLEKKRQCLLEIDAEIMRLYDLPPRYEKRILDMFQGIKRKGVEFEFEGYYAKGFESSIPLHIYISNEYQRSTAAFVSKWVEENRSEEIIKAFEIADEAFKGE